HRRATPPLRLDPICAGFATRRSSLVRVRACPLWPRWPPWPPADPDLFLGGPGALAVAPLRWVEGPSSEDQGCEIRCTAPSGTQPVVPFASWILVHVSRR